MVPTRQHGNKSTVIPDEKMVTSCAVIKTPKNLLMSVITEVDDGPNVIKMETIPPRTELSVQETVWTRADQGMRRWAEDWKAKCETKLMVNNKHDLVCSHQTTPTFQVTEMPCQGGTNFLELKSLTTVIMKACHGMTGSSMYNI